jgi:mannose-1-phosphate guanylyltransferase/mannose-6-phosphate isomerase
VVIQLVILAGGSGTRLWPASRQGHPKQLLALKGTRTLLQETALRMREFSSATVAPNPVIVTSEEYRFVVADQLREVGVCSPQMVLEPVGRNTAPALTLASLLLETPSGDPFADDVVLLIMASDHVVTNVAAFHEAVAEGLTQAAAGLLVTFGIVPTRPETGYGYIRVGLQVPESATTRFLAAFTEKPDAVTAAEYLAGGQHLWNSGIFMMRRSVWLEALTRYRPDIASACSLALAGSRRENGFIHLDRTAFTACPSDSIDYAVMEKLASPIAPAVGERAPTDTDIRAVVVPLDCGWSDVGAWTTLRDVSDQDEYGNVIRGNVIVEDTRGSLIHADSSRLVTVLGADDLVVVDTPDALLVAGRDSTTDLRRLVSRVREHDERLAHLHRKEARPWGCFDSVDGGSRFRVKRIQVNPGAKLSLQLHRHRAEHWVVVHGTAEVRIGEQTFQLREDQSTYIPMGVPHRLANTSAEPLEIIEVQSGDYLGEDDIVRLEDCYGRVDEPDN